MGKYLRVQDQRSSTRRIICSPRRCRAFPIRLLNGFRLALDSLSDEPRAKTAKPEEFYDDSILRNLEREGLFPTALSVIGETSRNERKQPMIKPSDLSWDDIVKRRAGNPRRQLSPPVLVAGGAVRGSQRHPCAGGCARRRAGAVSRSLRPSDFARTPLRSSKSFAGVRHHRGAWHSLRLSWLVLRPEGQRDRSSRRTDQDRAQHSPSLVSGARNWAALSSPTWDRKKPTRRRCRAMMFW